MTQQIPVTFAELITTSTRDEVLDSEITIATSLGMPTTAWQPVQVDRSTLAVMAQLGSNFTFTVSNIAQGAYAATASVMANPDGSPINAWMDLRGKDQYNVTRLDATFAAVDSTGFSVTNSSTTDYGTFQPNQLHFQNPVTLATYTNSAAVHIAPSATTPVAIVADVAGAASTSGPSTITTMLTPLIGCTCTNSASVIGLDEESNALYYQRCQAKLGTLSPNGPSQAYEFIAKSITDPDQPWYDASITAAITRVTVLKAPALVQVYVADAGGAPSVGDVAIANTAIQAWAVPSGTTAIVTGATNHVIPVTSTVYVPAATGLSSGTVQTAVSDALTAYFETIPIGGLTDVASGVVPYSAILAVIWNALPGKITAVTLTAPAADVTLAAVEVALLGSVTTNVVFT